MTVLARRSGSQILRTFLPEQTADVRGEIYRVVEWTAPSLVEVDADLVRRQLWRELAPWSASGNDSGVSEELARGAAAVEVVELDERRGVTVERFPQVWLCRACKRIGKSLDRPCPCGQRRWGQLHFVGVHECGAIVEPWIRRCERHDDVKVVIPKSAKATDIEFVCPMCDAVLMNGGLGYRKCVCGGGTVKWNVHKARQVYTPRSMVLINPPKPEHRENLKLAGGARRALAWVLEGLVAARPADVTAKQTKEDFLAKLLADGFDPAMAAQLADMAEQGGQLAKPSDHPMDRLQADRRDAAERAAVDIAMALAESRTPTTALRSPVSGDALDVRYQQRYPVALNRAGIDGLDLVDRFPVLNAMFGYTRGDSSPAKCRLVPFRKRGGYRLYGSLAETEAFLIRLDPVRVATWLTRRGHQLRGLARGMNDPIEARVAILEASAVPSKLDDQTNVSVGSDVLKLVHTYAHRFIRQVAVFSGIDRDALSEYLVPEHLGFFVYAAARGDFVLGGMQAVFESNLDDLLNAFVDAEHRCPLDPGCERGSGACSACVHLGEPSCRFFNRFLDRKVLFGGDGYLRTPVSS